MPNAPSLYRLVIFDAIEDPKELRELICKTTGAHPTDAVQWLARTPGLWPWPLDEATTKALLDGLYEFGIAAEARRLDQFPELGAPRTIHRAACLDEGLRIEGLRGEPTHWVPWERVELVCAGRIGGDEAGGSPQPRWPSAVVSGVRALALRKPRPLNLRSARTVREPVAEVLVVRNEPRVTFRFVENQMNFAYLGDRLRGSAAENFPLFLADLCDKAKGAYLSDSTRSLIEARDPGEHDFPTSQALLEHATIQLLWSWYRRDRQAWNEKLEENEGEAS
ncbi:hypothetical protein [Planctomyces sp. SH-PL62]|uniref:hypothetical protein n=1 Tax=Planctomyces sp. SH-PL62 TaxID=1636152 RepID=UPI00078E7F03|nr:hypothetical protein [Planctomyces sp. SH-PL62]AMV36381.1 hypothetical protein VT85_03020 [Planctomyces sp. SH-PL62]